VLSASEVLQERRRRPPASLKQQYAEYVLQRIENFKNSMSREELLRLGDEAMTEIASPEEDQFVLTEVVMAEAVDRLIMRRLSLRSYRRWRQQFLKLRAAQREPTRWGLEPDGPLTVLLPRIEPDDVALVVGPGVEATCYLLAAHDASVTFLGSDLASVEGVESRAASESLYLYDAFVVQLGLWMPEVEVPAHLVVVDTGALADVPPQTQRAVLEELQARTRAGGVHVLLPGTPGLAPEALVGCYDGWVRDEMRSGRRRQARGRGVILTRPPEAPAEHSLAL
jgi:hypothetical protein